MYRTFVILRHTFLEAILQPIYPLLLAFGAVILGIFALLPFFTLGEDTIMYKSVGLDVILLMVLIVTLFATSRTIFDEIEDRTMLTLMSKPVRRWEVLVGKYLGIVASAGLAIAVLGGILILCTWARLPGDYQLRVRSIDARELRQVFEMRLMNTMGLLPSLVLMWLQISVLAAIGVALSTRFSLVVNLPVVILLYIAGNLTRFLFPLEAGPLADRSWLARSFAYVVSLLLPYLEMFDLRQLTVYSSIKLAGTMYEADPRGVSLGFIWANTGVAAVYAAGYAAFALAVGMWLFQSRELGGSEG
ncbi:MAG TPA: ABC transporter permease subunit [Tepidisphaeraceae bacterium]|nr:ABC transporter permease subunit [Tepidisphaeraceae bacterium]